MLAPFWRYVRPFGRKSAIINPIHLFVALDVFFLLFRRFDPISAPFWLHFRRLWAPSGLDLGGFYFHSGAKLALSSGTWAQELHWMGWWGYAKRQQFSLAARPQWSPQVALRHLRITRSPRWVEPF